jgi:hypothetical protein
MIEGSEPDDERRWFKRLSRRAAWREPAGAAHQLAVVLWTARHETVRVRCLLPIDWNNVPALAERRSAPCLDNCFPVKAR